MNEKILEASITVFVQELLKEGKLILSEIVAEGRQLLGSSIEEYLRLQIKKYAHLKTLLRGNTPVYIYDIYYHLNVYNDNHTADTKNIKNVFSKSHYITVIGDAGSGKSTLIKHLFLNTITTKYAIPILVELRYLNTTDDALMDYICDKILENKISQNDKILDRLLEKGKFVFFLDGFDELNSERKQVVVEDICNFTTKYQKNKFILTTRPFSDIENLPSFHNYKISQLKRSTGDIDAFIDLQLTEEPELANKIKHSLNYNKSKYIESFMKNPLLLSLYILTFQSNAQIPDKKYIFYRRVVNALFAEHDSKTKLGFVRQKKSGLSQELLEEVLKVFCFLSFFDGRFVFDYDYIDCKLREIKGKLSHIKFDNMDLLYDLKSAIALWVEDNAEYSFAHRSLQEYFAVLFIKNLTEDNKSKLYSKIIDRFSEGRNLNEVENFLSLCSEMDALHYNKFYYLPLLYELRDLYDYTNEDTMFRSVIKYLCIGINVPKQLTKDYVNLRTIINEGVYKAIYIHYRYTRKINDALNQAIRDNKQFFMKYKNGKISFDDGIHEDIYNIIKTTKALNIVISYCNFIQDTIDKTSKYVSDTINNDQEFVDMI